MVQAYFNNIEKQIASCVLSANKRVYVAVAWFTNQVLFNWLLTALKRNVEVKILILNDILNRNEFGLDFGMLESNGAEVCFAESTKGLMHNKFCIIDDKVITGSYNWTYHANKNDENIIISDDAELLANYCEQFKSLFNAGKRIQMPYEHLKWTDVKEGDFAEFRRNIYRDVVANERDYSKELKKDKLKALNGAYKSGNQQDLIAASNMAVTRPVRTIMDVLTDSHHNFKLKRWEENIIGEPETNVDGHFGIARWYYKPNQLMEDEYHQEYIEGVLKTYDYDPETKDWEKTDKSDIRWLNLKVYDKEFIAIMKEYLNSKFPSRIRWKIIPDEIVLIEKANLFFYPFPFPMYNKSLPQRKQKIPAINVFGIVKEMNGDNITFYEGWNPNERGELIRNNFFESANDVQS